MYVEQHLLQLDDLRLQLRLCHYYDESVVDSKIYTLEHVLTITACKRFPQLPISAIVLCSNLCRRCIDEFLIAVAILVLCILPAYMMAMPLPMARLRMSPAREWSKIRKLLVFLVATAFRAGFALEFAVQIICGPKRVCQSADKGDDYYKVLKYTFRLCEPSQYPILMVE